MRESLGFVECDGLSSALVAADRMLKTAAVKLEGMHETMGIGWVTVKIAGDISAVQAAVDEVKASMPKVVIASIVLGSPAPGINGLGNTDIGIFLPPTPPDNKPSAPEKADKDETVNASAKTEKPQEQADNVSVKEEKTEETASAVKESSPEKKAPNDSEANKSSDSQSHEDGKIKGESSGNDSSSTDDQEVVTCNLCGDPKCPRKKGEPHKKCIHYDELKKNK